MSAPTTSPWTNPFPGLRPFREDEEHLFFGRENQVDAMVDKLADTRFLAVVGTSGSGKSSLVNCGLRPALRQGLLARAGTAWRMAQFRPGNDPIGAMARALAQDGVLFREYATAGLTLAEIIETTLRMSKVGLIDIYEQAALGEGVNLLVVVDQFEELFRYRQLEAAGRGGDQGISEQAAAFVNLLLEVKQHTTCPIFVVLTMRSDFLGDCTQFPGLAEAINAGQYLVPRMSRDERRAAIEGPIGVGGAEIAPVLLTRLVNDVGGNPDQLSILQHALNRTWARWQSEGGKGPLGLAHYEAIGTMAHALDQHAEQAYAELGTRQQHICEKLFKALTDKATDPRGVRRPTTLGTLCALADATAAEVADVIAVFRDPSRSFLMPPAGEALEVETVIDISHESLMRVWQRLIKWADEEAQSARTYRRLAETADLYVAGNASLWRDPELQLALDWREKSQPNETWAARYHPGFAAAMRFLTESSEAREAERAERQRQRQRELEAEQEKAEAQARYARRMRGAALISGALAVAALGFGAVAVVLGVRAHEASLIAETKEAEAKTYLQVMQITQSRSLVNAAEQNRNDEPTKILLALEALPDAREGINRPLFFRALTSLSDALDSLRELSLAWGHTDSVNAVAVMPDGVRMVTGSNDNTARVWDARTGAELFQLKGHTDAVNGVAVTADGARIVTGSKDKSARVWDARTGDELFQLKGHTDAVNGVAVTGDGARIVTGSNDETARVWDAQTGAELLQLKGHTEAVNGVAVTGDGARIVTGSNDKTARVWDAQTGAELLQLKGHTDAVKGVAVTADGVRIVTGSTDGTARIWDATTGTNLRLFSGGVESTGSVIGVAVTADGARIITGSEDNIARVWDTRTGDALLELKGHTDAVKGVAITADGARIVTASEDSTARVWEARGQAELLRLKGHAAAVFGVAVMPDGARIVTGSRDRTARVFDANTGAELLRLRGHTGAVNRVAVMPDGARIVTGSTDETARIWDARTGAEALQLRGHTGAVFSVAVMPDGIRIVTGSADNTARVWDARTGTEMLQLKGHTGDVNGVAVTSDGARIVTGSTDSTARIWDAGTGAELSRLKGHTGHVNRVAVTPDGTRIVTGSTDQTARIWDVRTGAELLQLKGHTGAVNGVAVTSDGARIVTTSSDGTMRIWDPGTGTELAQVSTGRVFNVAGTPDGARVVTGSNDGTWRLWDLAQLRPPPARREYSNAQARQALIDHAKAVVPRCLTIEERKTLLLPAKPPRWCIQMRKYPYGAQAWTTENVRDSTIAAEFGDYADQWLLDGDFTKALDAAELGITFAPELIWLRINRAHALMFLGRREEARAEYLAHRGINIPDHGLWEEVVVKDFATLRKNFREHDLMKEIEQLFKPSLPVEADE